MTVRSPHRAVLAAAALLAVASGCGGGDDDGGNALPDVEIQTLDGSESISLAEVDGPAVVNLWATWCPPCRREIPTFEAVHRERGDEVRFIGINIGEGAEQAQSFLDSIEVSYDQYLDPLGEVVTTLETSAMPVTIVIDADGRETTRHLGQLDRAGLNAAIDDALD